MPYIDLRCRESAYIPNECTNAITGRDRLMLGGNYKTYLFWDLQSYSYAKKVKQASIILYKIPTEYNSACCQCDQESQYEIYPLLNYFSIYCARYNQPEIDTKLEVQFQQEEQASYLKIDITKIVEKWLNQDLDNKGLLIEGCDNLNILTIASSSNRSKIVHPRLIIRYDGTAPMPLTEIAAETTVVNV